MENDNLEMLKCPVSDAIDQNQSCNRGLLIQCPVLPSFAVLFVDVKTRCAWWLYVFLLHLFAVYLEDLQSPKRNPFQMDKETQAIIKVVAFKYEIREVLKASY